MLSELSESGHSFDHFSRLIHFLVHVDTHARKVRDLSA